MSYFSEIAIAQQEMEQYRDDNGMWECEFAEWVAAHEQQESEKVDSNL